MAERFGGLAKLSERAILLAHGAASGEDQLGRIRAARDADALYAVMTAAPAPRAA